MGISGPRHPHIRPLSSFASATADSNTDANHHQPSLSQPDSSPMQVDLASHPDEKAAAAPEAAHQALPAAQTAVHAVQNMDASMDDIQPTLPPG